MLTMARLIAKMTATSNHCVIDKLSSKKINYAVIVSCSVKKQPNNIKVVKKSDEITLERNLGLRESYATPVNYVA